MFKMKHALVLTLALVSVAGQVHAGDRDTRTQEQRDSEIRDHAKDAGAAVGGHSHDAILATSRSVQASGLVRLSPTQSSHLSEAISTDPTVKKLVDEAVAQAGNSDARPIIAAQIEGLANLKGIDRSQTAQTIATLDPAVRASQSYFTLVTSVAPAARSWKGQSRAVVLRLLEITNTHIASSGMNAGDALLLAKVEVEKEINLKKASGAADYKINLDDIFKFCKTI